MNESHYVIQLYAKLLRDYDQDLYEHSIRVSQYAYTLALLSLLPQDKALDIATGAILHDIGKLEIEKEILNTTERLTYAEWENVKSHPVKGVNILKPFQDFFSDTIFNIIEQHHERLDAKGYPYQLSNHMISTEVRIVTIADCYDAMTYNRSYSKAKSKNEAINELLLHSGTQFDAHLVKRFIDYLKSDRSLSTLPFLLP